MKSASISSRFILLMMAFIIVTTSTISFATTSQISYNPIADTFTSAANYSGCNYYDAEGDPTIQHGNLTNLLPYCANFSSQSSFYTLMKFNVTSSLNKIIIGGNLSVYRNNFFGSGIYGGGSFGNPQIYWEYSSNNTWDESQPNTVLSLDGIVLPEFFLGIGVGGEYHSGLLSLSNPNPIGSIYQQSNLITLWSIVNGTNSVNGIHNFYFLSSREGTNPPNLTLTLADTQTGLSSFTTNFANRDSYFDFESSHGQFTDFNYTDFVYNIDDNKIYLNNGVSAVYATTEPNADNTLLAQTCASELGYSTSPITSINYVGGYNDVYCFDLSSQHSGRAFYGAIKVLNNTADTFRFYWMIYSPSYTTFSAPSWSPTSPRGNQNLTISYSTSQPLTTGLRFYYTSGLNYTSAIATLNCDQNFSTIHTIVIPSSQVPQLSVLHIIETGRASDNSTYSSSVYNISIGSNIGAPSVDYPYLNNSNYSEAFVLIPIDTAGYPVGLEMNCKITTAGGYSRGYIPSQERYYVESLGVTSASWLIYTTAGAIGQTWNVSCISDTNLLQNETHASVLIDVLPKIVQLVINPNAECTTSIYTTSGSECADNLNSRNISAWYCDYNANRCSTFNTDGSCLKYGTYIGYTCSSCSAIPAGFGCNTTVGIGQQKNGTSDVNNAIGQAIGNIFKINSASALAFIALIIFFLLGIGLGVYVKSATVIILGLLSGMLGFFEIGWLPIWIPIIVGLIAALLISKFIVNSINPQGSGGG